MTQGCTILIQREAVVPVLLALALFCRPHPVSAQASRSDSVEVIHGIEVADQYRWLEAMRTPRVLSWARQEDARARAFASGWPGRDSIRLNIERAANHDRYLAPVRRDRTYYFARVNSSLTRVSILRQEGLDGSPEVVVDAGREEKSGLGVNRYFYPSPDGTILAYGVVKFGSGWMRLRFRDMRTGRDLPDTLDGLRGGLASNVSWAPDGSGVFYDCYTPPSEKIRQQARLTGSRVAFHRMDSEQREDRILAGPYAADVVVSHQLTDDARWLVSTVRDGSRPGNRVDVFEVGAGDFRKRELVRDETTPFSLVGSVGSEIWLYSQAGAPNGRVVGIDVEHPQPEHWREIVAEQPYPIDTWTGIRALGDEIVGGFRENGLLRLRIFRPGRPGSRELHLPRIGSVWFGFTGRQGDPELFFTLDGFADPGTVYRHDLTRGQTSVFRAPELPYDPDDVITRQVFYSGEAGDSIPMYLAYHRSTKPDGRRPVMIYGYAFGGWSASPWFRPHMAEWFRMGGVFALPALRGGGEFGQKWAEAGIRTNRQNAVDDFVAAARWLVAHGLASPRTLVAETNSAGASVVGAAIIQHPDLFAAALFGFPLLDLLRYERFTGGAQWRSQLGSVEDSVQFRALMAYSPVHSVRPGQCYPAVLATPGELDETTPPFHAYKFIAALQRAQHCQAPALLRISWGAGHAYGRDQASTVSNFADQLAFIGWCCRHSSRKAVKAPGQDPPAGNPVASRCGRRRLVRVPGFVLSEYRLPAEFESQEHAHTLPGLVLPMEGRLTMTESSDRLALLPGEALTLPPGASHREWAAGGSTCLLVEPTPESSPELPPIFEEMSAVRNPRIVLATARLASSLGIGVQPGWELEYDLLELILLISHVRAPSRRMAGGRPFWISGVIDRLRAEFSSPPSYSDLAREAGVSREHLVRQFRRVTGETPGTFLRRLRVLEAARMLYESDRPISRVASAAGFVDQSHLTRQLRRYLGVTPRMLRTRHEQPPRRDHW